MIDKGGTIKERLTRLETLMNNHLEHHEKHDKWMLRIACGVAVGIILHAFPGFIKFFATVY